MKIISLLAIVVLYAGNAIAQNTFPSNGNVGIGILTPEASLEVRNNKQRIQLATGTSTSAYTFTIGVNDDGVNFGNNSIIRGFNFKNAGGTLLSITQSGNVGIGTTIPQSKLAVNGTVTAKQVKVTQTGWPDYVFDSSYVLPDLPTMVHYLRREHHLPGIPSALEIENNGLNLGDMQKLQAEKIEQILLYLIEQRELIRQQGELLQRQQAQIDALRQKN